MGELLRSRAFELCFKKVWLFKYLNGLGKVVVGKWRQLYLNNNKKRKNKYLNKIYWK